ncbi:MAG: hypothetical protein IIX44_03390 [Clostridia bacterium]|nr:hypothetical protein [Clostridia bacterium]
MTTRKFIPLLIIALLLPLVLASCEGIGDGALIGNINPSVESDSVSIDKAKIAFYDQSGNFDAEAVIAKEGAQMYWELLHGEYVIESSIDMGTPYIEISFYSSADAVDVYIIYSDGSVGQKSETGYVFKGQIIGLYEKLMNFINLEDSNALYIESGLTFLHYCDIKSYGLRNEVNLKFEGVDLWQIACYRGRADFSSEGDAKKGEGAYFVINYYSGDRVDSTICIYENDVVVVVKRGVNISVLSTKVDGYREGIFAEIERYLEGK